MDDERHRAVELIRFLAWLEDDPESREDRLAWAARVRDGDPVEPLELLRHVAHDRLKELQAAVAQDEPLPQARDRLRDEAPGDH